MRRREARYSAPDFGQSESASDWIFFDSGNLRAPSAAIRRALPGSPPPARSRRRYSAQAEALCVDAEASRASRAASAPAFAHLAAPLLHSSKISLNSDSHSLKPGMLSQRTSERCRYSRLASSGLPLRSSVRASSSTGDRSRSVSANDSTSQPVICETSRALSNMPLMRGRWSVFARALAALNLSMTSGSRVASTLRNSRTSPSVAAYEASSAAAASLRLAVRRAAASPVKSAAPQPQPPHGLPAHASPPELRRARRSRPQTCGGRRLPPAARPRPRPAPRGRPPRRTIPWPPFRQAAPRARGDTRCTLRRAPGGRPSAASALPTA